MKTNCSDSAKFATFPASSTPRTWNLNKAIHWSLKRGITNPFLPKRCKWNISCYLVPARSELSLEITAALACLDPTYTVLISILPHITFRSQSFALMPYRMKGMLSIRFLKMIIKSFTENRIDTNFKVKFDNTLKIIQTYQKNRLSVFIHPFDTFWAAKVKSIEPDLWMGHTSVAFEPGCIFHE